jgi:hypothetical protein
MVRVKNEEEFLFASIADHVDEVVIVDNGSSDGTPAVIEALCGRYRGKISRHSYPFEIRKVGRENWELASHPQLVLLLFGTECMAGFRSESRAWTTRVRAGHIMDRRSSAIVLGPLADR